MTLIKNIFFQATFLSNWTKQNKNYGIVEFQSANTFVSCSPTGPLLSGGTCEQEMVVSVGECIPGRGGWCGGASAASWSAPLWRSFSGSHHPAESYPLFLLPPEKRKGGKDEGRGKRDVRRWRVWRMGGRNERNREEERPVSLSENKRTNIPWRNVYSTVPFTLVLN